jgi:hypothetical protein
MYTEAVAAPCRRRVSVRRLTIVATVVRLACRVQDAAA